MSSNKKRRELNRAIEEHDRIKLSAQFAVGNHSMLNIAESILAKENAALKEQVAQLEKDSAFDHAEYKRLRDEQKETITTLQSKSAALVDALERARNRIKGLSQAAFGFGNEDSCSYIDAALAALKGEK